VLARLTKFVLTAAALAGGIWLGRRMLIRWIDGPATVPSSAPWLPLPEPVKKGPAPPAAPTKKAAPAEKASPTKEAAPAEKASPTKEAAPAKKAAASTPAKKAGPAKKAPAAARAQPPAPAEWVEPDESGGCPPSHSVKAKLASRIYHLPGMAAYDRTTPDRCYPSAEAAEADGFTRAKR